MTGQALTPELVENYRPLAELIPAQWQTGDITTEDGTRIHYTRTGGAKLPVLLIHGLQANGLTWLRTAQALERTYDVILPDLRGHGKSDGVEHGFSAAILASDIVALIRALDLREPFVVGHSLGAEVTGQFAATYLVRGAVLIDPPLHNVAAAAGMNIVDIDAPPPWMASLFATIRSLKTQSHAERLVSGLQLVTPGSPAWAEADYVSFIEGQADFDLAVFRYAMGMKPLFESPELIAQIECPLLLITARSMMPGANREAGIAAYEQNWHNGQHIHFEDSGHAIQFDQFDRFIEVLTSFLNAN